MFVEVMSYRDAVIMIENSDFLRNFVKLGNKAMMDFTFLCKAYSALSEETWKEMNEALGVYAKKEEKITEEKLRIDTTAYETNIHYPTDSSLLWDSYRTLSRVMRDASDEMRALGLTHRFHTKKVRKVALFISRNGDKKDKNVQRKIKRIYKKLIERVRWIESVGAMAMNLMTRTVEMNARAVAAELGRYLPTVGKIIGQAESRVIFGQQVPSAEKVYSLFEDHTELIKRGKARKPIEFGHKVLLAETGEKFILHYEVMLMQKADKELIQGSLKAHKTVFGCRPDILAGDKGFYESREQLDKLSKKIETVSICKKGRRTEEEPHREGTK
jgi:IS5 family transposase